jgi:hypothetical protein
MSIRLKLVLLLALWLAGRHVNSQPILALGTGGVVPGGATALPVWLMNSTNLAALQFDCGFDPQAVSAGELAVAPVDSGIFADAALVASNRYRVVLVSTNHGPLPNGQLANIALTSRTNAPNGRSGIPLHAIPNDDVLASTTNGVCITGLSLQGGQLLVGDAFGFTSTGGRIQFRAVDGMGYTVEASTNLVTWSSLGSNVATGGLIMWTDVEGTNFPKRFYRAKSP